MDKDLIDIIEAMEQAGESAESIAEVVQFYSSKQPQIPKGDEAEVVSGVSDSTSADINSSSELQAEPDPRFKPLEDRQEPTQEEMGGVNAYVDKTLSPKEIKNVSINQKDKDDAARRLQSQYEEAGVLDYEINDEAITNEAFRVKKAENIVDKINKSDNPKEQRTWFSNLVNLDIPLGSTELGKMIASIPEPSNSKASL